MSRRILAVLLCVLLLALPGLAADRDASQKDLRGIPHGHKHLWAVIGGTALGMGLGAIPGGASNVFKGAFIGGGAASAFYLAGHRGQEGPWSYVITNAALVAGIGWAVCDCGEGFGAGALVGGGGTALFQSFKPHNRTVARVTGANAPGAPNAPPPQNPTAPNPQALPQSDNPQVQPQTPPPASPQAPPEIAPPQPQTPQVPPPQTQPPQGEQNNPPQASLLPDAPQPKLH